MHLTPDMLAHAYEYLRTTPPFRRWKLPHADVVEFEVHRSREREGDHCTYKRTLDHCIGVSSYNIKTTNALLQVMAHEMVHAYQARTRATRGTGHNKAFHKLAARVCKHHGWAVEGFV